MHTPLSLSDFAKSGNTVKLEPNFGGFAINSACGNFLEHFTTLGQCETALRDANYVKTARRNVYAVKDSENSRSAGEAGQHVDLYVFTGKTAADRKFVAIIQKQDPDADSYCAATPWVLVHNTGRVDRFASLEDVRTEAEKSYGFIRSSSR